jgi:lysozyme family protein
MESNNFQPYFDRLIGYEGGYVNDPNDPGGETKWGISKRAYPKFIIKELTREDAYNIYKRDFWDKLELDNLSDAVTFQLFDFAVNSGIETAIRYLQRAIGVADDGFWGLVSRTAASKMSECDMIMSLSAERLEFMTKLKNWPENSKGWANRIAQNLRFGVSDEKL